MIEVKINNEQNIINSEEIKKFLSERTDFINVEDISDSVNEENIMAFDCKLDDGIFSFDEINELIEELGEDINIEEFQILFEDLRAFIKDATDEIESDLREIYLNDDIRCYFNVYGMDEDFSNFKLVFVISFKDIGIALLSSLTNLIGKKQLNGESKFYS